MPQAGERCGQSVVDLGDGGGRSVEPGQVVGRSVQPPPERGRRWLRGRGGSPRCYKETMASCRDPRAVRGADALAPLPAIVAIALAAAAGCTPQPHGAPPGAVGPTAPTDPPGPPPAELAAARIGRVHAARFQLDIPLPDPDGWKVVAGPSRFLVLEHARSSSRLVARTWRETENMNRHKCEQQARLLREFPAREQATVLAEEPMEVPPDFDTVAEVGLVQPEPHAPLTGYVMAFGGWTRRCFAFVYTTTAMGPGAEHTVGDRLAVMQDRSLAGTELRSETAPQIRSPHPTGSPR